MKTAYYHLEDNRLAVIDLIDTSELIVDGSVNPPNMYIVSRVNTPKCLRGRGLAKKLMTEMTSDADEAQALLVLDLQPYPGTDRRRLLRLYHQFGFELKADGSMMRTPRATNEYLLPTQ
jgi:GNAT superfamily N-acetyltransferase